MKTYVISNIVTHEAKELNCSWELVKNNIYQFYNLNGWWRVLDVLQK